MAKNSIPPTRTRQEAIEQGFVAVREARRVEYEYFHWCERTDTPFVRVWLKTRFAVVTVDLIGQSYRMSEHACNEIHDLLQAHHVGRWGHLLASRNRTIMYSPRIPIEESAQVARGIVEILAKPGYREPERVNVSPVVDDLDRALRAGTVEAARSKA